MLFGYRTPWKAVYDFVVNFNCDDVQKMRCLINIEWPEIEQQWAYEKATVCVGCIEYSNRKYWQVHNNHHTNDNFSKKPATSNRKFQPRREAGEIEAT